MTNQPIAIKLPSGKAMRRSLLRGFASRRRRILEDFANAHDLSHFRKRYENLFRLEATSDEELRDFQSRLRSVWGAVHGDTGAVEATVDWLFQKWFEWRPRGDWYFPPMTLLRLSGMNGVCIVPNICHFGISLAFGLVEAQTQLAKCRNPNCPAPYFLRNRRNRQYCERKDCAAYGQRQHKMVWWEKHKAQQLAKRKARRRREKKGWRRKALRKGMK